MYVREGPVSEMRRTGKIVEKTNSYDGNQKPGKNYGDEDNSSNDLGHCECRHSQSLAKSV